MGADKIVAKRSTAVVMVAISIMSSLYGTVMARESLVQEAAPVSDQARLESLGQQVQDAINNDELENALQLATEAMTLAEQIDDADELILAENNLAIVQRLRGELAKAAVLLDRALTQSQTKSGKNSSLAANLMNRLAAVLQLQGDTVKAEQLMRQSLAIRQSIDPEGAEMASALKALADVLDESDRSASALSLYAQSLSIEKKLPAEKKKPERIVNLLNDIAAAQQSLDQLSAAENSLSEAMDVLKQCDDEFERNSLRTKILTNLAMLKLHQNHLTQARDIEVEALQTFEKQCDKNDLVLADLLNTLAYLEWRLQNKEKSNDYLLRASKLLSMQVESNLPNLPLAGQRAFIERRLVTQVSFLIDHCQNTQQFAQAYDLLFKWKGLLLQLLRRESLISTLSNAPQLADKVKQLRKLRTALAASYVQSMSTDLKKWQIENRKLNDEKERLEQEISTGLPSGSLNDALGGLNSQSFCKKLGTDTAFIDIYRYFYTGRNSEPELHYTAIIAKLGEVPVTIDLGTTQSVDTAVEKWNKQASRGAVAGEAWAEILDELWKPVAAKLPAGLRRVWICPDGVLHRLPWHLVVHDWSQTASLQVAISDSARQINELVEHKEVSRENERILLAGAIDYDADIEGAPKTEKSVLEMRFLPGTLKEIQALEQLSATHKLKVTELTGEEATKEQVMKSLPGASYIHLATHGLFLNKGVIDQALTTKTIEESQTRKIRVNARIGSDLERSPMVQSALALSGANKFTPEGGDYQGLLTAEELIGINLNRCKHVTLSACETGLGTEVRMQGVLGLRAAIMAAGADSVLISLWTVPDEATRALMEKFYTNLWDKKLSKVEALRLAQEDVRNTACDKFKEPKNWAAWMLIGE